jgi:CubicO group peptidase (beta-lactamase class C family)
MIKKLILGIMILIISISCSRKMDETIKDTNERMKLYLDSVVKNEFPGIQYLVISGDRTLFEYNGGWSDVKNDLSVNHDTTFMLNSSTKPITALAILQLIQKGQLSLEDSLRNCK